MGDLQFAKQYLTTLDSKTTKFQPDHVFDPKTFQTRIPYTLPKFPHPPYPEPPTTSPAVQPPPGSAPADTSPKDSRPPINLTLKSTRNPNMTLSIPSLPASTPISTIKTNIQTYLGGPSVLADTSKIKILHNKKPIPSSKATLADAFAGTETEGQKDVVLSVMVMGGAPDPPPQASTAGVSVEAATQSGPESEKAAAAQAVAADAGGMEGVLPTTGATAAAAKASTSAADELDSPEFWSDLESFLRQRLNSVERATELRGTFEKAWRSAGAKP